jgi:hypothetical protein
MKSHVQVLLALSSLCAFDAGFAQEPVVAAPDP